MQRVCSKEFEEKEGDFKLTIGLVVVKRENREQISSG